MGEKSENYVTNSVSNSSDEDSSENELSSPAKSQILNKLTKVTEEEDTSYLDELLTEENVSPYEYQRLKGHVCNLTNFDLSRRGTASTIRQ
jgi:hypothetical protein